MNRMTVILLAALDAAIALGVGVAIPLVPLTVMWALRSDVSGDWIPFWRAASDVWLLGHGVDLTVTLDPVASAEFGLAGTNVFPLTIAALGFALLTVIFGSRTGRRAWSTPHPAAAAVAGVATFAVLSALLTLSAHTGPVVPSLLQGAMLPAGVFAIGFGIGLVASEVRDRADPARAERARGAALEPPPLPWPVGGWSPLTRTVVAASLRAGTAAASLVVAAAAVLLAVLLALDYGRIVGLYESLQPGALGASALTLAQLALLPNAVVWTASWLAGPGFAVGVGSSVNVAQTALGPLPSLPLFGVLPQGDPGFGLIAVLVPVLCGVAVGILTRRRLEGTGDRRPPHALHLQGRGAGRLALIVAGSAVCSGAVLGLLAWWSSGSMGPGRLQQSGPNPLLTAGAVAAEVLVGMAIGVTVGRRSDAVTARSARVSRRARSLPGDETSADRPRAASGEPDGGAPRSASSVVRGTSGRSAPARPRAPRVPTPQRRVPPARVHDDAARGFAEPEADEASPAWDAGPPADGR